MEIKVIWKTARCAVLEIADGGIYETKEEYTILLNHKLYGKTKKVITSLYGLKPDTEYEVCVEGEKGSEKISFCTEHEFVTLNVKDFGAKGDGKQDDTTFIQAAIMSCPKQSRILIPKGIYKIRSLFLKDDIRIELAEGAVLSAYTDRTLFPILQDVIQSYDEKEEYNLGTWEGNPLPMFAGIVTGIGVKNVEIYGQGMIEGNAGKEEGNWWYQPKIMNIAFRPRMLYLNHCENVTVQGIQVQNSPSWNIHPYFSDHLKFLDLKILNPKDSPNTDGLDPESCCDVELAGIYFSLGDDCVAVKSGKIYMGAKYKKPSEDILIHQCCMRDGHGSITIGSEMAGGVKRLTVKDCLFLHTDRGLRIKTRRGRGKDAIIEDIVFENIHMDHVMTPFVINSFYYCDPDGHTEYVRSREVLPVDERTPDIRTLKFKDIDAENCHVAAAYMCGLPEQKIRKVEMENVKVSYTDQPTAGVPAMMEGAEEVTKMGIYAYNVEELILRNVKIEGQDGEELIAQGTNVIWED